MAFITVKQSRATPRLSEFDGARRRRHGVDLIGGVDEAGRGPLAGPVVAACVVLRPGMRLAGLDDSKVVKPRDRERLVEKILAGAAGWGVGWATAAEIDRVNILQATHLAAARALGCLSAPPGYLITDFLKLRDAPCPVEAVVDGDARSQAVAAASILAKVARDRIMRALDPLYPWYGFADNKGYGSAAAHRAGLERHGPCTLHRMTFGGVRREATFFEHADPPPPRRALQCPAPGASRPAAPDWLEVLTRDAGALDPLRYLPECEWDAVD